jgi:hypothetical protein
LSTFQKTHEILEQEGFQTVLRAIGETETTQENFQDWLQLDEGDLGFQLVILWFLNKDSTVIFLFSFISTAYIIKFSICFPSFFVF